MKYKIWRTNRFNENLLSEFVAECDDLDVAKGIVDYQATLGNTFVVLNKDGVVVYDGYY